jgi:signal transduction histidine kinase
VKCSGVQLGGETTAEQFTIEDLAGLFGRFEEDLRQSMLVKDLAAASASALDAAEVAHAYLETAATAGAALWGAVWAAAGDSAELLAEFSPGDVPVRFATGVPLAEPCGAELTTSGRLPHELPPGLDVAPVGGDGHAWVRGELRHGGECLGSVVLGFDAPDAVPQGGILGDAFARLASALHNARLYEAQALAARLNRLLDDADVRMLASATPEDVSAIARESIAEGLGACDVAITLPDASAPTTHVARIELVVKADRLEASFRVMERPGRVRIDGGGRREFSPAELDFVTRLVSTMALAVESRMLQVERDELMRAREQWVADLSHDIRTPLASIRGYAELLSTGSGIDEAEVQREAGLIARQATAIERLVEDLQTAFRLRFDKLPVSLTSTDIGPLVAEALEAALWHAGRGRSEIPFDRPEQPVQALVDRSHFSRVVANIATNALVHNPPETRVSAVLTAEAGRAHLTIADDGLGMDEALAERVCRRGQRGPDRGVPGSGLGMAIAHELTHAMGGQIRVESAQGRGTAVTVSVPLDPEGPPRG